MLANSDTALSKGEKISLAKRVLADKICPVCGTLFRPRLSRIRYCSCSCGQRGHLYPDVQSRFQSKFAVDLISGCWLWTAHRDPYGYGGFCYNGKNRKAHAEALELYVGPVPDGMELHHRCRNPLCVDPDHLEPVTHKEHAERHAKTHCHIGHPLTGNNLALRSGRRQCRTCERQRYVANRNKAREAE
jgi:HNH endonuclease